MGLDIYFTKEIYIGAIYHHREIDASIKITTKGKEIEINPNKVMKITEQVLELRNTWALLEVILEELGLDIQDAQPIRITSREAQILKGKIEELNEIMQSYQHENCIEMLGVINRDKDNCYFVEFSY
jgi:hypothetical protein